jgi:hypothetical protein
MRVGHRVLQKIEKVLGSLRKPRRTGIAQESLKPGA